MSLRVCLCVLRNVPGNACNNKLKKRVKMMQYRVWEYIWFGYIVCAIDSILANNSKQDERRKYSAHTTRIQFTVCILDRFLVFIFILASKDLFR